MAKYYSSTFGKISGKHGNAVAVIRKDGSTYLRLHVPARNPRTDKQQAHRAKFALTSKSLVPFNPIFKETIGITNGISTARSYAFKNAVVGEYPNLSMDYEKLMFSFGMLEKLNDASVTINESVLTVNWSFKRMNNCHKDDSVSFIIFNKNTKQSLHVKDIAERSDKEINIDIYDSWANCELYVWAYVTKDDKISDSVFVRKHKIDTQIFEQTTDKAYTNDISATHKQEMKTHFIGTSTLSLINGIIISFIAMLLNLLRLFKRAISTTKIMHTTSPLRHYIFNVTKHLDKTSIPRLPKLNINRARRRFIELEYFKYYYIYTPVPIRILSC